MKCDTAADLARKGAKTYRRVDSFMVATSLMNSLEIVEYVLCKRWVGWQLSIEHPYCASSPEPTRDAG